MLQKKHSEAQPYFERAAAGRVTVLGAAHSKTKVAERWKTKNLAAL